MLDPGDGTKKTGIMKTAITYRKEPIQIEIEEPLMMSRVKGLLFYKISLLLILFSLFCYILLSTGNRQKQRNRKGFSLHNTRNCCYSVKFTKKSTK